MTPSPEDRIAVRKHEPEFEPVEARPPKRSWGKRLTVMVVLIVGGGVGWHFLDAQIGISEQNDVPVIRSEVAPVKIKPADPGGLDVPDRDKLVYDRLNGESAGTDVESLLPPPEEPMERPQPDTTVPMVPEETTLSSEPENMPENMTGEVANPEGQSPTEASAPVLLEPSAPAPVEPEVIVVPPAPQPETTRTAAATPANGEQYRIQLAALRTHASAESEWNRLKKAHPDILGPFSLFVVMVDKGGTDGVYYRLQAGDMPSRDAAKTVCDKLAGRNVACLVKRPGS